MFHYVAGIDTSLTCGERLHATFSECSQCVIQKFDGNEDHDEIDFYYNFVRKLSDKEMRHIIMIWYDKNQVKLKVVKDAMEFIVPNAPGVMSLRNVAGKTALDIALETGMPWNFGIDVLVMSNLSCITTRSMTAGLYPFMNAAVSEKAQVDVIYELLRLSPCSVHG